MGSRLPHYVLGGQLFGIVVRTRPNLSVFEADGPTAECWRFTFRRLLPSRLKRFCFQGIGILYVRMLASPRLPCSPLAVLSLPAGRLSLLSLLSLVVSRGFSGEGSYMWSGFSCCEVGLWFSAIWRGIIFWVPSTLLLAACMTKPIKHARCPCRPM
jgi:hypothetical protein